MPVPPPMEEICSITSMITEASTQVAIAKYPSRSRATSHHSGSAHTAAPIVAMTRPAHGVTPCIAGISTKYAPSPRNACCPTDTSPAYPASRFHIEASVSTISPCTMMPVVPGPT